MKNLDPKALAYLAAVKRDFPTFLAHAFPSVYPNKSLERNWHIEAIAHALALTTQGQPRLILNLPPRHLKSYIVSVCWPAFLLAQDPSARIFCVSYAEGLAKSIATDFRRLVTAPWYRQLFPQTRFSKDTELEMATTQGGFRAALTVNGSITGRGADLIVVDDPAKPEEAQSEKARTALNEWFRSTLLSRLDDKQFGGLILVQQRLHVNDLTGFLEERGGYKKLALAALAERDEVIDLSQGRTYRRPKGEALQPKWESRAVHLQMRENIGEFNFQAQYQQSPKVPDGTLFKSKWFKRVAGLAKPRPDAEFYIGIDGAQSTSATADFTAITVSFVQDCKLHVIKAERGRWDYEKLKAKTMQLIDWLWNLGFRPTVVVERASSGISLIQYLETRRVQDEETRFLLRHYQPHEDKVVRAARILPLVEQGVVVLDEPGNTWVEPYLGEFMAFPYGAHDDQVDSLVVVLHCCRHLLIKTSANVRFALQPPTIGSRSGPAEC